MADEIQSVKLVMFGQARTIRDEPITVDGLKRSMYRLPSWIRVRRMEQIGDTCYVIADLWWRSALTSWSFWRGIPEFLYRRLIRRG